jgi:hypothetical protein
MKSRLFIRRKCLLIKMLRIIAILGCLSLTGCGLLPDVYQNPQFHNPFPQLSRVAVVPFFNFTNEPTVNGEKVAIAYYNELQAIPGFEVVPVPLTQEIIQLNNIDLNGPKGADEARRLAQIMKVDAVVVGAVTDYSPYYPPRMGLEVQWYARNPGFHPIPAGYGLPWGTPNEADIPGPLVFEAEMSLAKEQMKSQTPPEPVTPVHEGVPLVPEGKNSSEKGDVKNTPPSGGSKEGGNVKRVGYAEEAVPTGTQGKDSATDQTLPADWPDPKGFIPPGPRSTPPPYRPCKAAVLHHIKVYHGNDSDFTTALSNYYALRDEARFGGYQGYLQRSDDFIRFCCRMHITEMLSARGGSGEAKTVWRWPNRF